MVTYLRKFVDLTGMKFNRWTALYRVANRGTELAWKCRCDCGKEKDVRQTGLRTGTSKSCGCWNRERLCMPRTHGWSGTSEYTTWNQMKERCLNPKVKAYSRYGGRGISVCDRWREFSNFLEDMGPHPEGLTLERIDNDGNYEPRNCRWATRKEQNRNRKSSRKIAGFGRVKLLCEWADELNLSSQFIHYHVGRGKTIEQISSERS